MLITLKIKETVEVTPASSVIVNKHSSPRYVPAIYDTLKSRITLTQEDIRGFMPITSPDTLRIDKNFCRVFLLDYKQENSIVVNHSEQELKQMLSTPNVGFNKKAPEGAKR